jgi:hypothetical protein
MDVQLWTGQGHMDGLKRDKPREKEVPFGALWKVVYQTSGPIPWKKEYHNYSYLNSKSLLIKGGLCLMKI